MMLQCAPSAVSRFRSSELVRLCLLWSRFYVPNIANNIHLYSLVIVVEQWE